MKLKFYFIFNYLSLDIDHFGNQSIFVINYLGRIIIGDHNLEI